MGKFEKHVLVCRNRRPAGGKPCCGRRGGDAVLGAFETALAERPELWGRFAVTGTDCLGPCFDGPNAVVYPDGVWYAGVTADDARAIVDEHLIAGRPVERLRYDWADEDDEGGG